MRRKVGSLDYAIDNQACASNVIVEEDYRRERHIVPRRHARNMRVRRTETTSSHGHIVIRDNIYLVSPKPSSAKPTKTAGTDRVWYVSTFFAKSASFIAAQFSMRIDEGRL